VPEGLQKQPCEVGPSRLILYQAQLLLTYTLTVKGAKRNCPQQNDLYAERTCKRVYNKGMNKLSVTKRAQILGMMVEGVSIRSVSRTTNASKNTIVKPFADAGQAYLEYQDKALRNLSCKHIQADEIWSFVYSKQKDVPEDKRGQFGYGDVWMWTAIDADSKLIVSWYLGRRDAEAAYVFMTDLASRLSNRIQLTTHGHHAYLSAVDVAFDRNIDYAQLVKIYGTTPEAEKRYSPPICLGAEKTEIRELPGPEYISTGYVERQDLSMRMGMRRSTWLRV
jgi:IS1 family transposase